MRVALPQRPRGLAAHFALRVRELHCATQKERAAFSRAAGHRGRQGGSGLTADTDGVGLRSRAAGVLGRPRARIVRVVIGTAVVVRVQRHPPLREAIAEALPLLQRGGAAADPAARAREGNAELEAQHHRYEKRSPARRFVGKWSCSPPAACLPRRRQRPQPPPAWPSSATRTGPSPPCAPNARVVAPSERFSQPEGGVWAYRLCALRLTTPARLLFAGPVSFGRSGAPGSRAVSFFSMVHWQPGPAPPLPASVQPSITFDGSFPPAFRFAPRPAALPRPRPAPPAPPAADLASSALGLVGPRVLLQHSVVG